MLFLAALVLLCNAQFALVEEFRGTDFLDENKFYFDNFHTDNLQNMVNRSVALKKGLLRVIENGDSPVVFIGIDDTGVLGPKEKRDVVELHSYFKFNHSTLLLLDAIHMPFGCGIWPGYWTFGNVWPTEGEIDIIEGVNLQKTDLTTLHTGPGCNFKSEDPSKFTGYWNKAKNGVDNATDCNWKAPGQWGNQGCGIWSPTPSSFGREFNEGAGGISALFWDQRGMAFWWFQRQDIDRYDVATDHPNPGSWGKPYAYFEFNPECLIGNFINQKIVFNAQLCGDWASSPVEWGECSLMYGPSCSAFVRNKPDQLGDAYWLINFIRVFKYLN